MNREPAGRPPGRAATGKGLRAAGRRAYRKTAKAASAAEGRLVDSFWPVLQQTAAATLSWWIARHVIEHHQPYFAPVTTIVALNAAHGERGTNAVRLVLGVIAGVMVAQSVSAVLHPGYASLGLAVLLAILAAIVIGGERVTMAQAAVSAIIAVAAGTRAGADRVVDALLGGSVALLFSQLLFPAHPLTLLRRAEAAVLTDLADALSLTAVAADREEDDPGEPAGEHLHAAYTHLGDLGEVRESAGAAVRRSPIWWGRRAPVERESELAASLGPLANSCFTLVRTATALEAVQRRPFAWTVRELSAALRYLSAAPGDRVVRQRAADRALGVAGHIPAPGTAGQHPELTAAWVSVGMVILDILAFTGAEPDEAKRALRESVTSVQVGAPPELGRLWRLPGRYFRPVPGRHHRPVPEEELRRRRKERLPRPRVPKWRVRGLRKRRR